MEDLYLNVFCENLCHGLFLGPPGDLPHDGLTGEAEADRSAAISSS